VSKLGFDIGLKAYTSQRRGMLREMMGAAQRTFDQNFENESVDGRVWEDVVRDMPPPILDVTGQLRGNVVAKGNVQVAGDSATLTVDPIDKYGRGYASYHQEGTDRAPQREYMRQTNDLTDEQVEIIADTFNRAL
jgi:hypothetical protein